MQELHKQLEDFIRRFQQEYRKNFVEAPIMTFINNQKNKKAFNTLREEYPFLTKLGEVLYFLQNPVIEANSLLCVCGNKKRFTDSVKGYSLYCSRRCYDLSPTRDDSRKATFLRKYGVDFPLQNKSILIKTQETLFSNTGVHFPGQSKEMRVTGQNTCLEKYSSKYKHNAHIQNANLLKDANFLRENFVKDGYLLLKEMCSFFNVHISSAKFYCYAAGITEKAKIEKNKTQNTIYEFLRNYETNVCQNDRKLLTGKEVDIYLPERRLAVEYDGLLYHSFGKSSCSMLHNHSAERELKNRHIDKTDACEKRQVQLLHIFENEWLANSSLWKSVLRNALGLSRRVYARKCAIKELTSKESRAFLEENHLQGSCNAAVRIGLYYDSELVAVMSFSKPRFNKNYEWELIRFCSKRDTTVVGGASKLLKFFIKSFKPTSIISYANRRWSIGHLYETLGFKRVGVTKPNYFYFKPKDLILRTRNEFQKHKLKHLLELYDSELTETENMYNNGYRKIYDCGSLVYTLSFI